MAIKEIKVRKGSSQGGYEFNVLETPSTETYSVIDLKRFNLDDYVYWHGYIKASEIKSKKFPLEANPRKPQPSPITKRMAATIQKSPEMFHHLNNGITIISKECSYNESKKEVTIRFGQVNNNHGDGICNGGHTYYSIEGYNGVIPDNCLVRIEIIELSEDFTQQERSDTIKEIAEARNAHNQLKSSTSANFSGYYEKFKLYLGDLSIYFRWLEGDPEAVKNAEDVKSFIAMLTSVCPHWGSHKLTSQKSNHKSAARGSGGRHDNWMQLAASDNDDCNMYYMIPLIKDILSLRDLMAHSLLEDNWSNVSTRFGGTRIVQYLKDSGTKELSFISKKGNVKKGYKFAHTFGTMMIGAFRENVWFSYSDIGINLVGWLVEPKDLWNTHREDHLYRLHGIAQGISSHFGQSFLANDAIYNDQFAQYQFGASIQSNYHKPSVLYDVESGDKYIVCNNKGATHILEFTYDDDENIILASLVDVKSGIEGQTYKKVS